MRAHVIKDGKIVNTIEVASLDFLPGLVNADVHGGAIGDLWNGTVISKPAPDLTKLRADKIAALYAYRDKLVEEGGYKVTVGGVDYWITSDVRSKVRQLGLSLMGANVPAKDWRALDGKKLTLNQAVVQSIFQAAAAQELAIDDAAEAHKAAIEASLDPANYNFSGGWPATFIKP